MTDTDPNTTTAPPQDKPQESAPAAPIAGQAPQGEKQENLPEKFKGKSAEEIAKSYLELEKTVGSHTDELKKSRDQNAEWEALGRVIKGNPTIQKVIQDEIDKISGKPKEDAKPNGEAKQPVRDDTRIALEDQIINTFEDRYGLNRLTGDRKKELDKRIGQELADMLDPGGRKIPSQIINDIPLDRLPKYLEKAYQLATIGDEKERIRGQAFIDAKMNDAATIGSMPSTGGSSQTIELTAGEREAARRMNVTEEQYKKQKIAILKGE